MQGAIGPGKPSGWGVVAAPGAPVRWRCRCICRRTGTRVATGIADRTRGGPGGQRPTPTPQRDTRVTRPDAGAFSPATVRRALILLAGALALSCASLVLLNLDFRLTDQTHYSFMAWNLVLAWIPVALSLAMLAVVRWGGGTAAVIPLVCAWVLFLPNAPYLATDLVHLGERTSPRAADAAMFAAFAVTGVYLGLMSAWFVCRALRRIWTSRTALRVVNVSLALCGVGIYLGRVVQVNSWEAVTAPATVIHGAVGHVGDVRGWAVSLLIAGISAAVLVGAYHLVSRVLDGTGQGSPG